MHAISLHFMYYNFCRIHQSLRVTLAMEAGISDHVWDLQEVAALIKDAPQQKEGHIRKEIQTEPLPTGERLQVDQHDLVDFSAMRIASKNESENL